MKKFISIFLVSVLILFCFSGCKKSSGNAVDAESIIAAKTEEYKNNENPVAIIVMDDGSTIVFEMYKDIAPNTVSNFVSLANKGFYDGLIFHRVIPDFMIQGGDPLGTGFGDPGYSIKGEFTSNGFENNLSHKRGVVSMARGSYSMDSAGSQFFICVADSLFLDGDYAAFGMVIEGMEKADAIVSVKRDSNDKPLTIQSMKMVRVINVEGISEPETIEN